MARLRLSGPFKRFAEKDSIAPDQINFWAQWLEIFLIPLLAVGLAWWASPTDPLLLKAPFSWLWLAPVLVALRYGVYPGLLSCVPILLNWLLADYTGVIGGDFTPGYFFGGGLLVLVCGEFADVWRDRNERMDETNLYLTERLSRLTKRHLLLNLSHDRLEQEMLARPGSLRDALARLRSIAIEGEPDHPQMPGAVGLLQLLSQYVNIESAALYLLEKRGDGVVLGPLIARIGEPEPLAPDDELLRLALVENNLAHIASHEVSLERNTSQLVVAPLISGSDDLIGVMAVTRMPFFSLNVENLQMMSVILAYYADNVRHAPRVRDLQGQLPTVPALFAEELVRMTLMQQKVGIASHIVVMTFAGAKSEEIPAEFLRIKRGLDLYWQTRVNDKPVIAVLLPFASPSATQGFQLRIEGWLAARFAGSFESLGIQVKTIDFELQDPVAALIEVVKG